MDGFTYAELADMPPRDAMKELLNNVMQSCSRSDGNLITSNFHLSIGTCEKQSSSALHSKPPQEDTEENNHPRTTSRLLGFGFNIVICGNAYNSMVQDRVKKIVKVFVGVSFSVIKPMGIVYSGETLKWYLKKSR